MGEENDRNQNLGPGGEVTPNKAGQPKPEDLIVGKFKTQADLEKGYVELEKDRAKKVEELRLLKEEKGDVVSQEIAEREVEIEKLKKQIADAQSPTTRPRYNPQRIKQIEEMVGLKEGEGEGFVDLVRGLAAHDRGQDSLLVRRENSVKSFKQQWNDIKESTPREDLEAIGPEISQVMKRYPGIAQSAGSNPEAGRDVIKFAEGMHAERIQARKAEEKLREDEKIAANTALPGAATKVGEAEAERQWTMSLEELEKEVFPSEEVTPGMVEDPYFKP